MKYSIIGFAVATVAFLDAYGTIDLGPGSTVIVWAYICWMLFG